jgi:hypothetical protein
VLNHGGKNTFYGRVGIPMSTSKLHTDLCVYFNRKKRNGKILMNCKNKGFGGFVIHYNQRICPKSSDNILYVNFTETFLKMELQLKSRLMESALDNLCNERLWVFFQLARTHVMEIRLPLVLLRLQLSVTLSN